MEEGIVDYAVALKDALARLLHAGRVSLLIADGLRDALDPRVK